MTDIEIGDEYGREYAGLYRVRALSWKEGREILRRTIRSKDPTEYIEELIIASVISPPRGDSFTNEKLGELPSGLVRRLMDETLRVNDISRPEANFLPS